MARLRLLIIGLAVWLIVLFNMARPDIFLGRLDLTVQLSPVLYVIAAAAVIIILLLPDLGQVPIWTVFGPLMVIYIISRFALTPVDPLEPKHSLYFIITELLVLFGTVYSARLVSLAVSNFEKAVENVIVNQTDSRVLAKPEGMQRINDELYRARMHSRTISIIHVNIAGLLDLQEDSSHKPSLETAFQRRYLQNQIARIVETALSRTDIVFWYDDCLLVCMPETTNEYAIQASQRLSRLIKAHIGNHIMTGIATFPTHGLIIEDLITAAIRDELVSAASLDEQEFNHSGDDPYSAFFDDDTNPTTPSDVELRASLPRPALAGTAPTSRQDSMKPKSGSRISNSEAINQISEGITSFSQLSSGNAVSVSWRSLLDLQHSFTNIIPTPASQRTRAPASNQPEDPNFWVNRLPYQSQTARSAYRVVKRLFDLTLVILSAPITIPVFLVVALLTLLDSGWPIFFTQERTGLGGRRFKMYKFRTMVPNAEALLRDLADRGLAELDASGKLAKPLKLEKDPRITRLGRILRKTSLDEVPQLFNVLRDDMSLVGPRPTSWGLTNYTLIQTERLNAKPGITGLWQVYGRGSTDFSGWVKWDVMYFEKMSFSLDLRLLLLTVKQVLKRRGAH